MSEFREGVGLPPLRLSERGRQTVAFLSALLGLTAGQLGLLAALTPLAELEPALRLGGAPAIDHEPLLRYWPDGSTVSFAGGATVLPMQSAAHEVAAIGAAATAASALGVIFAVLSRSHERARRRRALLAGYLYVLAELAAAGLVAARAARGPQLAGGPDLERQYHTAFANAMWDYLYDPQLKVYLDTVQQELSCCGAGGFTDWFLTDWLRPGVYKERYYMNLLGRLMVGLKPNESYYSLAKYGSIEAQNALVPQLGNSELTAPKENELFFNEVPFSCCDPESPIYCRQQFANRVMFAYDPANNLTVFDRGCASAVAEAVASDASSTVAPLWWLFGVKLAALMAYRLVQTSQACALSAGRHLSPARGWVILLWPSRGGGGPSETDPERQPLVEGGESTEGTGESTEGTGDTETTGESEGTAEGEAEDGGTEDTEEADNIPPPPPMDD
ncbi:Peripherin-2 [Amphibalanus amphitrite]|uniref:Peripherin-2 n=1 Tax=Amphibalanus amphitrite TaxID=1232801 RepID=A0A6A4VJT7_AMPAM|nr:Peripherin-2 [Amphibalanus amphitrite]